MVLTSSGRVARPTRERICDSAGGRPQRLAASLTRRNAICGSIVTLRRLRARSERARGGPMPRLQQDEYHVFVSHESADKDLTSLVADEFRKRVPDLIECCVSGQALAAGVDRTSPRSSFAASAFRPGTCRRRGSAERSSRMFRTRSSMPQRHGSQKGSPDFFSGLGGKQAPGLELVEELRHGLPSG